ncbi:nuclear GTPase SLIP-GC-like [Apteryx mantelli]|uniref:Nuclear GTPase SLIP-GC-like n=1 Tax=Apteryx mantelli TaxID=2696672 RepID=A0A8B7INU7_9AVES
MAEAPGAEGGNAEDIARKRPRTHQAFQDDEQRLLKHYEKIESKAKKNLNTLYGKISFLFQLDEVPDQLRYLRDRFVSLKEKSAFGLTRIGLFGSTGAGKSTLLNALLDKRFFLPVSGTRTCTSCQVQISTSRNKYYEANIFLLSEEEWRDELRYLFVLLESENNNGEKDDDMEHAIRKLRAVYGEGAERKSYQELLRAKPAITIPSSRRITLKKAEAEELSKELDPYIRNQDNGEEDSEMDVEMDSSDSEMERRRENMRLWPLIKHVEVTLPVSDLIPEGVVFVDIPGTGDSNKERDEMWKESILECSSIWVIADVERVFGAKEHEIMLREAIKACQAGKCSDITFVVTKTDKMNTEEYLRDKGRAEGSMSTHDAILECNKSLKRRKGRAIKDRMQKHLPSDSEILQKSDLVYTVSAKEYWRTETLSIGETEISVLRDHVRKLHLNMTKNLIRDYMKDILVFFNFMDVYICTPLEGDQPSQKDELDEYVRTKIQELGTAAGHVFDQMDLPLLNGVRSARKLHKKNMENLFNQGKNSRGFHKTLKALCVRKGVFVSRIFNRLDINSLLAQPIYDHIDAPFGSIFRKQRHTKASLQLVIDEFSTEIKKKFTEVGRRTNLSNVRLNFLLQETDIIMKALERQIFLKKKTILESLVLLIQSILSPHYDEAAKICGKQTCENIKNKLYQSVEEEVAQNMFEKAKEKMKSHFNSLKVEMTMKLEKDFSNMLSFAFSPWDRMCDRLPVFDQERQEIESLYNSLQ